MSISDLCVQKEYYIVDHDYTLKRMRGVLGEN